MTHAFTSPDPLRRALTPGSIMRRQALTRLRSLAWGQGLLIQEDRDPFSATCNAFRIADRHSGEIVCGGGYELHNLAAVSAALERLKRTWIATGRSLPIVKAAA